MGTWTSRWWVFPKSNQPESWSDLKAGVVGCRSRENSQRKIPAPMTYESGRRKWNSGLAAAATATATAVEIGTKNEAYNVSEEDKKFIEDFRDAYPYVFSHRGRTFVVLISAQIVASSRLHALLKQVCSEEEVENGY